MKAKMCAWIVATATLLGCERFERAGPVECEALYDHVMDLSLGERSQAIRLSENADSPANSFARAAAVSVGRALLTKFGEKDKYLARCQTLQTKGDVRECLGARTVEELHSCGAM